MGTFFAVLILVGLIAFTSYNVVALVKVIRAKKMAKSEKKENK